MYLIIAILSLLVVTALAILIPSKKKDFDSQIEAYKHLASKFELEYVPSETTTIKNSFEM